jgi:hypothetical protein
MDWPGTLRWVAIVAATAGGMASLGAFALGRRPDGGERHRRGAHILYLVSYLLMSLSIFFLALAGILGGLLS